jgi:hypothetical protein
LYVNGILYVLNMDRVNHIRNERIATIVSVGREQVQNSVAENILGRGRSDNGSETSKVNEPKSHPQQHHVEDEEDHSDYSEEVTNVDDEYIKATT